MSDKIILTLFSSERCKRKVYLLKMEIEDEIFIEDDQDILDIINFGFPRRRYERTDYFNTMNNMSFFRRFRLTKPSVLQLLELIEDELEFENDL